jgi:hypothetical protein
LLLLLLHWLLLLRWLHHWWRSVHWWWLNNIVLHVSGWCLVILHLVWNSLLLLLWIHSTHSIATWWPLHPSTWNRCWHGCSLGRQWGSLMSLILIILATTWLLSWLHRSRSDHWGLLNSRLWSKHLMFGLWLFLLDLLGLVIWLSLLMPMLCIHVILLWLRLLRWLDVLLLG